MCWRRCWRPSGISMGFGEASGPGDQNEDIIVIHLGKSLTDEQFERVQNSVIAFMNARWPNVADIGIDN